MLSHRECQDIWDEEARKKIAKLAKSAAAKADSGLRPKDETKTKT